MMVLVDTSVWIDHLRSRKPEMVSLENSRQILIHPMVIGELACGNLPNRYDVLKRLEGLPQVTVASDDEVLFFIEHHQLMGTGIGYIDAHLIAACILHGATQLYGATQLWTRDRRVTMVTDELGISFVPNE